MKDVLIFQCTISILYLHDLYQQVKFTPNIFAVLLGLRIFIDI